MANGSAGKNLKRTCEFSVSTEPSRVPISCGVLCNFLKVGSV